MIPAKSLLSSRSQGRPDGETAEAGNRELGGLTTLPKECPQCLPHSILEGGFYCLLRACKIFNSDLCDDSDQNCDNKLRVIIAHTKNDRKQAPKDPKSTLKATFDG